MKMIDVINGPWAVERPKFDEIVSFYVRHLGGEKVDVSGMQAMARDLEPRREDEFEVIEGVAVIPISGVMTRRLSFMSFLFGGTSTMHVAEMLRTADESDEVSAIVLDIDSPGGEVAGTQELAAVVAGMQKPIRAYTGGSIASAAYWVASAADSIHISGDTNAIGSIGVVATHVDYSRALDAAGVTVTEVVAGRYKRAVSDIKPLDDVGMATLQAQVDHLYGVFLANVAEGRNMTPEAVHEQMGDGRIFLGQQAVDVGLVDGVSTFDAIVADLAAAGAPSTFTMSKEETGMEYSDISLDDLTAQRPDLVEAIGAAASTAERERIQAVEEQALPGHEALIQELKFDGSTSGAEAAVKVLRAEKETGAKALANLQADAPAPAPSAEAPAAPKAYQEDESLPIEDRAAATWENDPSVRAEFGSLDNYTAFRKAEAGGRFKVKGG